jgi:hypothetical protein
MCPKVLLKLCVDFESRKSVRVRQRRVVETPWTDVGLDEVLVFKASIAAICNNLDNVLKTTAVFLLL